MHQAVEKLKTVMKIACVSLDQRRVQILTADLKKKKKKNSFFFHQFVYVNDLYPFNKFEVWDT